MFQTMLGIDALQSFIRNWVIVFVDGRNVPRNYVRFPFYIRVDEVIVNVVSAPNLKVFLTLHQFAWHEHLLVQNPRCDESIEELMEFRV